MKLKKEIQAIKELNEQEKQAQADTQDRQTCTQLTRAQGSLQPLEAEAMEQERPPVGDMQAAASEQERTHGVTSAPAQVMQPSV